MDVYYHWLCQEVQNGTVKINYIQITSILADSLMKALSGQCHQEFIKLLGLEVNTSLLNTKTSLKKHAAATAATVTTTKDSLNGSQSDQGYLKREME